jgi:hypothetical protein
MPFKLPAVALRRRSVGCSGFRSPMTALEPWSSYASKSGNGANPPNCAVQGGVAQWPD